MSMVEDDEDAAALFFGAGGAEEPEEPEDSEKSPIEASEASEFSELPEPVAMLPEDEPEDEINTNTRLHYAELTMCMLTRGGAFLPQLSQLLFDVYNNDVLPALTLWESKAFPDGELWYPYVGQNFP